ncbi:MAG: DUF2220 domain-containing protein [Treponema sp.]|jgi:hypothetical protein|nr:DUF2220 domain-containing protein [Treponema sp.]
MTEWERRIAEAFTSRCFAAAARMSKKGESQNTPISLRLRSAAVFPAFDTASADEKESYLEAAESLERAGLVSLKWEKRGKGERLHTLTCKDTGALFGLLGKKAPALRAQEMQALIYERPADAFLRFVVSRIGRSEPGEAIDADAMRDLIRLLDALPEHPRMTARAFSVALFNDSKRLEQVLALFIPWAQAARRKGIAAPPLESLRRSFPETLIAGKIALEYKERSAGPPLVNSEGLILGLPLASIQALARARALANPPRPAVLTIENKETFYVLSQRLRGGPPTPYDCMVYSGGYPNEAVAALLGVLAASGFAFYHAGDLDPGGILILQRIADIVRTAAPAATPAATPAAEPAAARYPVTPVYMDDAVFDRYLPLARPLDASILQETKKIRADTKAVPSLAALLRRIEETRRGVEQEIIDYR